MQPAFDQKLAQSYAKLSPRLRQAGDYLAANPIDTATRSLRTVAEESGIAPATFSRLARALGYPSFDALRDAMRAQLGRRVSSFSTKADDLRQRQGENTREFLDYAHALLLDNLDALMASLDPAQLDATIDRLAQAETVMVLGALGSAGIAEYAGYMGRYLGPNWQQAGRMGASVGGMLCDLGPKDALLVITKPPHATVSLRAAEEAHRQGAYVVTLTSSHTCPALRVADSGFILPSEGANFFSSYATTLFFLETLIAMMARRSGPEASERIAEIERQTRLLGEVAG